MAFLSIVIFLLFVLLLIQSFQYFSTRARKLPPGPKPLPVIGSLHLLGNQPHKSLANLARIHGPVMLLRLGFINTVVISSAEMAKEIMQKQDMAFSTRTIPDAIRAHDQFKFSVIWLPVSARWRSLRKVLNSSMFSGTRLDASQHLRVKKVEELVVYCKKCSESGTPVDLGRAAFRTSLNLLSNTIFSKDLTDPCSDSAKEFKEIVRNIMVEAGKPNLVDFFPFLERIDPQRIRGKMTVYFGKMMELFSGLIDERLEKKAHEEVPCNDVLDVLLATSKESPEEIDRTHIERMFVDLFVAGTDTTSNTVEWAMTETLRNPEIMGKAKAELEQVIGKGKIIDEADVSRLPYLSCIVKETLRIHTPAPFLIPRRVEQDVELLCGYTVPKDSQVLVNCWAIGRDPDIWKDPSEFKPERFLDSQRDVRGRDFELIPFGAGRRICPGLPLAVRMAPVMVGSLLNSFDWKLLDDDDGGREMDIEDKFGITLQKADPLRAVPVSYN